MKTSIKTIPTPPPKPSRHLPEWIFVALAVVVAYFIYALTRPLPVLTSTHSSGSLQITTKPSNLPWPSYGQSAMGLVGSGVVSTHGNQTPVPVASTAKVLTALTVLKKYPLQPGESGPTITLDATDVGFYNTYAAEEGSVVRVQAGEQITERQMLEAMLLPSGNNMADSLARWAYGSLDAYATAANQYALDANMVNTHVGTDASGFSPSTTSTAGDLVTLGILAMQNPTLAQIVKEPSASVPVVGTVTNRNTLLGTDNIVGIKTGNSDQDPGVFLGAATTTVNGVSTTVVTAITGGGSLDQALQSSTSLINAAEHNFASTAIVQSGEVLGIYKQPWGGLLQAVAAKDLVVTTLQGDTVKAGFVLRPITTKTQPNQTVGTLTAPTSTYSSAQSVTLTLSGTPTHPNLVWRLLHAF